MNTFFCRLHCTKIYHGYACITYTCIFPSISLVVILFVHITFFMNRLILPHVNTYPGPLTVPLTVLPPLSPSLSFPHCPSLTVPLTVLPSLSFPHCPSHYPPHCSSHVPLTVLPMSPSLFFPCPPHCPYLSCSF